MQWQRLLGAFLVASKMVWKGCSLLELQVCVICSVGWTDGVGWAVALTSVVGKFGNDSDPPRNNFAMRLCMYCLYVLYGYYVLLLERGSTHTSWGLQPALLGK